MGQEYGMQGHKFWKISFRGVPLLTEEIFWWCITYIHLNPVVGGLCERMEAYRWSSARLFEECRWSEDFGINPAMLEEFCPKLLYDTDETKPDEPGDETA